MKTKFHRYHFDISKPEELAEYNQLFKTLKATPGRGKWMNTISTGNKQGQPIGDVTLQTTHLFDNQWNTEEGFRVFDWYEGIYPNRHIKRGHYLDITPEMIEIRKTTFKCGYCGSVVPKGEPHRECLSSEYITPDNFHLIYPKAVSDRSSRKPLSEAVMAEFTAIWLKAKEDKAEAQIAVEYARRLEEIKRADAKFQLKVRLLELGIPKDMFITYGTDDITIGWNNPVSKVIADWLEAKLKPTDIPWTIKSVDGVRTWKG
jgi:hypothetical protein